MNGNTRGGVAAQALRNSQSLGLPILAPLIDNERIGSFWVRKAVAIGTGDTVITHKLGRKPSIYLVGTNSNGGVIYDGSAGPSAWTPTSITLRATVATVATIVIG